VYKRLSVSSVDSCSRFCGVSAFCCRLTRDQSSRSSCETTTAWCWVYRPKSPATPSLTTSSTASVCRRHQCGTQVFSLSTDHWLISVEQSCVLPDDNSRTANDKKLYYRRLTARRAVSVKILSTVETSHTKNQFDSSSRFDTTPDRLVTDGQTYTRRQYARRWHSVARQ